MTYIPAAVKQGLLPEARLDDAVYPRDARSASAWANLTRRRWFPISKISPDVIGSPGASRAGAQGGPGIDRAADQQGRLSAAGSKRR